jgi:diguanylate cyclase (GGDEF)-like protein/PAS domain S-box-containing protein
LLSTLAEILAAAFGTKGLAGSTNGVVAALATGLLASLAIAEQMRQEHLQRLEAQAELQQTFEAVPVGLFSLDMEGHFINANAALLKVLGAAPAQAIGNAWFRYFTMDTWTRLQQLVHGEIGGELEIHEHVMPGGGAPRSYLVKATLARGKIEGSLQDITEKVRATGHLQFLADNDSLTRSLNRRGIEKELEHAMARLSEGQPLALAYLDLDRFKLINDLYGRNAGDEVLQHVCTRANNVLSRNMRMGRLGGDEFLLVLPDTKIELASLICQRIISSLSGRPYDIDDKAFHVRGSIGLIEVTSGTSIKDAISTADRACREAKAGHGDGLVVYEKGSSAFLDYEAEIKLAVMLATPTITEGMYLAMQPIMSLSAPHDSLNFEVLLRMNDIQGQPIRTDHLIKAAESSGRMGVIDRWVLATTLAWLNENYETLKHTKFICMNLNGASLNDERFLDDVVVMLAKNRHVAHQLCYEITESVALNDLALAPKWPWTILVLATHLSLICVTFRPICSRSTAASSWT